MLNEEYLAFIGENGVDMDGNVLYTFHFTTDTESVWGNYFNVAPASLSNRLEPDENSITSRCVVKSNKAMEIAAKNNCFSMQDCIDGIIPLMFSPIDDKPVMVGDELFKLDFGESTESVKNKLTSIGIDMPEPEIVEHGDETAVDQLMSSIDKIDKENNDYDDEFGF